MLVMLVLRPLLLAGFIKLVVEYERPFVWAAFYAGLRLLILLILIDLLPAVLGAVIVLATASLFFWLLDRFEAGSGFWWLLLVGGVLVSVTTGLV